MCSTIGHLGVIGERAARGGGDTASGGGVYVLEQVGARTEDLGTQSAGGAIPASMPKTLPPKEMKVISDWLGSLHAPLT